MTLNVVIDEKGNFFNSEDYQAYLEFKAIAKPNAGCGSNAKSRLISN